MHGSVPCPRAVCRLCGGAGASGGEPGLDLQGQLVQGVLVNDQGLVQQVVSNLGWGNMDGQTAWNCHRNLPAFLSLSVHFGS